MKRVGNLSMKGNFFNLDIRARVLLRLTLIGAIIVLIGCRASHPPISPAAANFKKEVKNCLTTLSASLVEPVSKKDLNGIQAELNAVGPQAVKLCRMCPFNIGVLNRYGETLAVHPPQDHSRNFSSYDLITKTINSKKIQQQRFFLQDGSQLYIICAPIMRNDKVIGLTAIAISAEEAKQRWGLTEKEFLSINFNT
jgi:hypothetical protein